MSLPVFIDTDCAMGLSSGDVDDGFALAELLSSDKKILGVSSTFGNNSQQNVHRNLVTFLPKFREGVPLFAGGENIEAASFVASIGAPYVFVALGPLTTLASAMKLGLKTPPTEVVIVGGNQSTWGRWPPIWPFEYNLTKDKDSLNRVFQSSIPITAVTLDVAGKLRLRKSDLDRLNGSGGEFLREESQRWLRRRRRLYFSNWFSAWDLTAAMYVTKPELFNAKTSAAYLKRGSLFFRDSGARWVRLVQPRNYEALMQHIPYMY